MLKSLTALIKHRLRALSILMLMQDSDLRSILIVQIDSFRVVTVLYSEICGMLLRNQISPIRKKAVSLHGNHINEIKRYNQDMTVTSMKFRGSESFRRNTDVEIFKLLSIMKCTQGQYRQNKTS